MLLNEALALHEGAIVCHHARLDYLPNGTPVKMPMRITKVWINDKRTIVMVRIAAVAGQAWLDATGYELPPKGKVYDHHDREWITPAELKARKQERHNGTPAVREPATSAG